MWFAIRAVKFGFFVFLVSGFSPNSSHYIGTQISWVSCTLGFCQAQYTNCKTVRKPNFYFNFPAICVHKIKSVIFILLNRRCERNVKKVQQDKRLLFVLFRLTPARGQPGFRNSERDTCNYQFLS